MSNDFEAFWQRYPRKVGKLAALKAYQKALTVAMPDEILAGLEEYRKHLPDDVQFIAHASSWLNAGRWMDDYTPPKIEKPKPAAFKPYVPLRFRNEA